MDGSEPAPESAIEILANMDFNIEMGPTSLTPSQPSPSIYEATSMLPPPPPPHNPNRPSPASSVREPRPNMIAYIKKGMNYPKSIALLIAVPLAARLAASHFPGTFEGFTWKSYVVIFLTMLALLLMMHNLDPDMVLICTNMALLLSQVISTEEALAGLSSSSVLSIGILFVIARAMQETGVVEVCLKGILGRPQSLWMAILRLSLPVAVASAFMNNTPVVAMMIPVVENWASSTGHSASKLLMPLSFASMLGGMCTLIGTSTNLILKDLAKQPVVADDDQAETNPYVIDMFTMSPVGIPLMLIGVGFLTGFSCLLPTNETKKWTGSEGIQIFLQTLSGQMVSVDVEDGDTLFIQNIEKFVTDKHLKLFSGVTMGDPTPQNEDEDPAMRYRSNSWSVGSPKQRKNKLTVDALTHSSSNHALNQLTSLAAAEDREGFHKDHDSDEDTLDMMSVIDRGCLPSPRQAPAFLSGYHPHFMHYEVPDGHPHIRATEAYPEDQRKKKSPAKMWFAGAVLVSMISLAAADIPGLPLFTLALTAAFLLINAGCITTQQALDSIKGRVLLTIFATYGLGAALQNTGVARLLSHALVLIGQEIGAVGLLCFLFLNVSVLSCVISNQATVILLWPVVSQVDINGLHLGQFAVILMMGASASFATPIGYQTNLMVLEPGNYTFADFARVGAPLTLVLAIFGGLLTYWFI